MKKQGELTQKELVRMALEMLGGKAQLDQIYPVAIKLIGKNTTAVNVKNNIRRELNSNPLEFKPTPGVKGGWELISHQEEIAELKQKVSELTEKNKQLAAIPKDINLIEKILPEIMDVCMHDRMKADPLRIVLRHLGYEEAAAVLDAWIGEKEDELIKALEKLNIHIRNITMTGKDATYNENKDK